MPRTILQLQDNNSWKSRLLSSLNTHRINKCMEFEGALHYGDTDDVCGKIIHLLPVDDACENARADWASPTISNIAFDILVKDDMVKAKNLIMSAKSMGHWQVVYSKTLPRGHPGGRDI